MKKIILASAIAVFGFSNAQIKKGTVYLSGQLSYSHEKDNNFESKVNTVTIMPTAGFFVASNFAVGLGVGYANSKMTRDQTLTGEGGIYKFNTEYSQPTIKIAPFARKYWNLSENLYLFGQIEIPVEFGKEEFESNISIMGNNGFTSVQTNTGKTEFTRVGVNIKPGLDYFLNKNWSLEATLGEFGYSNFKLKGADEGINTYNFGVNFASVGLGVKYVFAK